MRRASLWLVTMVVTGACSETPVPDAGAGDGGLPSPRQVTLEAGTLEGFVDDGALAFLNIPYAKAPVGSLRWRPPEAVEPWTGVRPATDYGPACPHNLASRPGYTGPPDQVFGQEDCLNLNVWTPEGQGAGELLPVMFFIHGGGNIAGSNSESLDLFLSITGGPAHYEGPRLAARGGVVVVVANYRLGVLGFLAHPDLGDGTLAGTPGNYGLKDQIAALQWVQRNIEHFGGDPNQVTIFGQSAGAYNVCALMTSPLTEGLFHRAIMHSGVCSLHPLAQAVTVAEELAAEFNCQGDARACLSQVSVEELVNAKAAVPNDIGNFSVYPHVDGYVAPKAPLTALQDDDYHKVPFMIGCTADEYAHRYHAGDFDESFYQQRLLQIFGPGNAPLVAAEYPSSLYGSPPQALSAMFTDRNLTCSSKRIAAVVSARQTEPVWRYHFRHTISTPLRLGDGPYHTSDLHFVFQHMTGEHFTVDAADVAVEGHILDAWTNFARTGNPNRPGTSDWPQYDALSDPYYVVQETPTAEEHLRPAKCAFWNSLNVP